MIFLSQSNWLTGIVAALVLTIVGAIDYFAARRRGWRAWPIVLLSTLFVPILLYAVVAAALIGVDKANGLAGGFTVEVNWLFFLDLVPAIIGAGLGLVRHRQAANDG